MGPLGESDSCVRCGAVPTLPGAVLRVAALEGEITAGTQGGVDRGKSRQPISVVQENLGDVAGHNEEIGIRHTQGTRITFDPLHAVSTGLAPGEREHRRSRVDTGHLATGSCQLARQQTRAAAQVENAVSIKLRRQTQIEIRIGTAGVVEIVQLHEARIDVVRIKLCHRSPNFSMSLQRRLEFHHAIKPPVKADQFADFANG